MNRGLAAISNILSSLLLGGFIGLCMLIGFALWDLRPSDLMSPGPDKQWNEYVLGYGIALPISGFFYLVPCTILLSWFLFLRGRYGLAIICGWLPLLCPLLTALLIVLTLTISMLTR